MPGEAPWPAGGILVATAPPPRADRQPDTSCPFSKESVSTGENRHGPLRGPWLDQAESPPSDNGQATDRPRTDESTRQSAPRARRTARRPPPLVSSAQPLARNRHADTPDCRSASADRPESPPAHGCQHQVPPRDTGKDSRKECVS